MDRTELALILALLMIIMAGLAYQTYWGGIPETEPVLVRPNPVPTPFERVADLLIEGATTPIVIDLNAATALELVRELEIEPDLAKSIISARARHGGRFEDPRDLLEIPGISPDLYRAFASRIAAGPIEGIAPSRGPLDINTCTEDELRAVPGLGPVLAQRILDARKKQGRFPSWEAVGEVPGVGGQRLQALQSRFILSATADAD